MEARSVGLLIALLGGCAVVVGLLIASGALGWFGNLPGDLRIRTDNVRVYVPLTSMLLVSLVLTLVVSLVRRLL
jgi:hypothetical protein